MKSEIQQTHIYYLLVFVFFFATKIILFFRELELGMKETADLKHQLKIKKYQLTSLILKPLFPKGFSGKYPDSNIEFGLIEDNQKAVDVMRKAIEEIPLKWKKTSKKSKNKRIPITGKNSKRSEKLKIKKS